MSYGFRKAFLAANAEQFKESARGQSFVIPGGGVWVVVNTTSNDTPTGYQAALLKNSVGEYVMVSRGTEPLREPLKDGDSDIQMGAGKLPDQVSTARSFLESSTKYIAINGGDPNTQLSLVGPSLGGSITQILGAENPNLQASAFNPYGVGNLIAAGSYSNVTNYVMARDFVSVAPGSKMIGTTFMFTEPGNTSGDTSPSFGSHFASNFLDPAVSSQAGKAVVIDVTMDYQRPIVPIDQVWIIDLFAPFGGVQEVMKELREKMFAGQPLHQLIPDTAGQAKTFTWPAVT